VVAAGGVCRHQHTPATPQNADRFFSENAECTTNPMKKSDLDGDESFDFRNLFSSATPCEIEAACLYEYMCESKTLN
jgi:hypothetical protein